MKKNVQLSLSQNDHFEVCDDSRRSRIAIAVAAAILSMSANVNAADTFIDAVLPSYSHVVESGNPGNISLKEALQKPLFPSQIEQNCSVRFFFTTSKNGVFLPSK